jgi:hypothetical protein
MKFINFISYLSGSFFALLDPDPDCESGLGYGSRDPVESGSNRDPDPDLQHRKKAVLHRLAFHFSTVPVRCRFRIFMIQPSLWHCNESYSVKQQISALCDTSVKKLSLNMNFLEIINIAREACGT